MDKPFKFALLTGRYQNLQDGHVSNIKLASELADRVLVAIGSAQEVGTERNPFPAQFRSKSVGDALRVLGITNVNTMLLNDLTNENDICTEWGDYVLNEVVGYMEGKKPDLIIHGDDGRTSDPIHWFLPEARAGIHFLMVPRDVNAISGTRMRELLIQRNFSAWCEHAPRTLWRHFQYMHGHLLTIPFYHEKYKFFFGDESK